VRGDDIGCSFIRGPERQERGRARAHRQDLRAYYQTKYFGITREVRAVDGVSLHVDGTRSMGWPANRAAARPR